MAIYTYRKRAVKAICCKPDARIISKVFPRVGTPLTGAAGKPAFLADLLNLISQWHVLLPIDKTILHPMRVQMSCAVSEER